MSATSSLPIDTTEGLCKMRRCAALLPEPAPEIVVALVDEVLRLRSEGQMTELERASAIHKEALMKARAAESNHDAISAQRQLAHEARQIAWEAVTDAEKELIRVSSGASA